MRAAPFKLEVSLSTTSWPTASTAGQDEVIATLRRL
jgi:hypothetical protein